MRTATCTLAAYHRLSTSFRDVKPASLAGANETHQLEKEKMIMKATLPGLLALAIIAGAASQAAAATADDGCDMNWTNGSWSRPVFKC